MKGGEIVQQTLEEANRTFDDNDPARSIPILLKAARMLSHLPQEPWVQLKRKELEHVICACAGIRIDAATAEDFIVPGGGIKITTTAINRSMHPFILERIALPYGNTDTLIHARLENNIPLQSEFTLHLPDHIAYTQPYWLQENPETGSYNVSDQHAHRQAGEQSADYTSFCSLILQRYIGITGSAAAKDNRSGGWGNSSARSYRASPDYQSAGTGVRFSE